MFDCDCICVYLIKRYGDSELVFFSEIVDGYIKDYYCYFIFNYCPICGKKIDRSKIIKNIDRSKILKNYK